MSVLRGGGTVTGTSPGAVADGSGEAGDRCPPESLSRFRLVGWFVVGSLFFFVRKGRRWGGVVRTHDDAGMCSFPEGVLQF